MCRIYRGKSDKIEEIQEFKHTNKRVGFIGGINEQNHLKMESEVETKSDYADIPIKV